MGFTVVRIVKERPQVEEKRKKVLGLKHNEFDWTWQVMQALQPVGFIHLDK